MRKILQAILALGWNYKVEKNLRAVKTVESNEPHLRIIHYLFTEQTFIEAIVNVRYSC